MSPQQNSKKLSGPCLHTEKEAHRIGRFLFCALRAFCIRAIVLQYKADRNAMTMENGGNRR